MKWRKSALLVALTISLTSCLSTSRPYRELPPETRIELTGFSINTLNEPGWFLVQHDGNSVQLAKDGANEDETRAIQAWAVEMPEFYNDEAFVNYVARSIRIDADSTRYVELKSRAFVTETKQGRCVQFMYLVKDLAAVKRTSSRDPMLLEAVGINCRNPNMRSEGAHIVISNRYYPGNREPLLPANGALLFNSLQFR